MMLSGEIKSVDRSLYLNQNDVKIDSNAKVVFSGLGADEVFGGYARYRTAF